MTHHVVAGQVRFCLAAPAPCPCLPGRNERRVFAHLPGSDGASGNDTLTQVGFRRSQNIAYRPSCEACDACWSARIPVTDYVFSRSERRSLERNSDLTRQIVSAQASMEQFELLSRYLHARHAEGGMVEMAWPDYVAMVEDTAVKTHLIEYRAPSDTNPKGDLIACALVDVLADGLSLVYSFFDPDASKRSLGSFVILDHVVQARRANLPKVYLGYWVKGSDKMAYKARFSPLEILRPGGWILMSARDRATDADPQPD